MIILLHSSKTMKAPGNHGAGMPQPPLVERARQLDAYLKTLTSDGIARTMHVSPALAAKTHALIAAWNTDTAHQSPAIDSFVGDIYSGFQAEGLSAADKAYAQEVLIILSGLYGVIRPLDGIMPYRLEMAYTFPDSDFKNLYAFWGDAIATCLPDDGVIVNVSSVEYTKAVLPYIDPSRVVTPRFLTVDPKTGEPTFVVVHAKIARGAFARWLITSRTTDPAQFRHFDAIGYSYDARRSTPAEPVFVCQEFLGKGLSMRLK